MTIATLIAAGRLDDRLLEAAVGRLAEAGLSSGATRWIDSGDAVDLEVTASPGEVRDVLEGWEGVDVIAVPQGARDPGLFVADMDSTMIGQECIDELADFVGLKPRVAQITDRAMRGELDFQSALAERVALLAGMDAEVPGRCLGERVSANPGAATLVATLSGRGVRTVLVTGGFTAFAEPFAKRLGFDEVHANRLEIADGRLTGRTVGGIVDGARKKAVLEEQRQALGLPTERTMAIGDGANDAAMVAAAGLGVGFRPKPALAEVADAVLLHHPLSALLWALGIPRRDWLER